MAYIVVADGSQIKKVKYQDKWYLQTFVCDFVVSHIAPPSELSQCLNDKDVSVRHESRNDGGVAPQWEPQI